MLIDIETNRQVFKEACRVFIHRKGVDELLDYLENHTDFFTAPCSTRFHLSVEGGLVEHSLNVAPIFNTLCMLYYPNFDQESRYLCSLFHDVCKANTYKTEKKSRKTDQLNKYGKPIWEDYIGYTFEEEFPYGHGEKSVFIISKFVELTDEEALAIRWHMGFSDVSFKGGSQTIASAMERCPVISALHCADLLSTSLEE